MPDPSIPPIRARQSAAVFGLLCLLTLSPARSPAQEPSGQPPCPASDTPSASLAARSPVPTATRSRRLEWTIPAPEAARLIDEAGAVLVDIRHPDRFAALRVPGSLNIPAHQIKTKAFLRGKPLLLLGAGHSYQALERTASELSALGRDRVAIVDGGLSAWRRQVGPLQGTGPASRITRIGADALLAEQAFDHWRTLLLDHDDGLSGDGLPPPATRISISDDPAAIAARLSKLAAARPETPTPLVLIASADGRGYSVIRRAVEATGLWNLFYLDGGVQAYQRQRGALRAMRQPEALRLGGDAGSCVAR